MTIQMVGPNGVKYAPARDILYLLPQIVLTAGERLSGIHDFPPLTQFLQERCITEDDLAQAIDAYTDFLANASNPTAGNIVEALEASGWTKVKPEAQIALMFYVGSGLTGGMFVGMREHVLETDPEKIISSVRTLLRGAVDLQRYRGMNWFERWLYRNTNWLRHFTGQLTTRYKNVP